MMNHGKDPMWDVIVIGAGAAGLTASIYLARAGKKVLLLDKGAQPGGRAISTEMADARVNLGAHALYKSALPILREVGVNPVGAALKPSARFVFSDADGGNREVSLPQLMFGSFLAIHEKMQLLRFIGSLRKTDASELRQVTLQDYLEDRIPSPRVRSLVQAFVRLSTYSDAPALLSAGAAIEQLKQGQVLYLDGGWQSLVNGLTEQAQRSGVSVRTNAPAGEIVGEYPDMTVTLKDGTRLAARQVLSTVGPAEMLALLRPALTPSEAAVYRQLVPTRAACLDLVVAGMPRPKTTFALGADRPWYYSNHSAAASLTVNPAHAVVHVMKYLSPEERSDARQDEQELQGFLDIIQPGWRNHVVKQRFLPHMLVSHGIVTAAGGGLPGRPGPAVEGRPGLVVAGDWVGTEGMLLNASLASAREAARCLIASGERQGVFAAR